VQIQRGEIDGTNPENLETFRKTNRLESRISSVVSLEDIFNERDMEDMENVEGDNGI